MINVKQEDDNTFTITWDENDPKEKVLNTWTQEDFINAIQNKLQSLEELGVLDNATKAIEEINNHIEEEFFIDQSAEEVQQDLINAEKFVQDNYIQATNKETYGDQGTEQSKDRTLPPPGIFPLFP